MKSALATLALSLMAATAQAAETAPSFSAFSVGDKLHVTVLGDSCNQMAGSLTVDPVCKADRLLKNLAVSCAATLNIHSTKLYCNDADYVPRVVTISLEKSNIAPEAKVLVLNQDGQTIQVPLNR